MDVMRHACEWFRFTHGRVVMLCMIDFVDGKEQSVLAAVFQIIIRFLKFDEEEESKTGGGGIDVSMISTK